MRLSCEVCGKIPESFRDRLSYKEWGISGMCQKCQDEVFQEDGMNRSDASAFDVHTFEEALAWAEAHDLIVKLPEPNELFLDLDNAAAMDTFWRNRSLVDQYVGIEAQSVTESRNGGEGRHVIVTLTRSVTPIERCLLQAILGSDLRREAHGFWRISQGSETPTLFFEKGVGEDEPVEPVSTEAIPDSSVGSDEILI